MNNRIKLLRREVGLSMAKFGESIGISSSAVSFLESGRNKPTEQTIKSMCREFGVREEWLRSGSGDMYEDSTGENAAVRLMMEALAGGNSFKKKVLTLLCQLDESEWDKIEAFARMLIEEEGTSE